MSPFAEALRALRFQLGLRQQELSQLAGCDRSYLSALENDLKSAPTATFLDALSGALQLPGAEANDLRRARERSRRSCAMPADAPAATYDLVYDLFSSLDRLCAKELKALKAVLEIGDPIAPLERSPALTRNQVSKEEAM
jgi:transcriptional regulator with XRE-family HTH domain